MLVLQLCIKIEENGHFVGFNGWVGWALKWSLNLADKWGLWSLRWLPHCAGPGQGEASVIFTGGLALGSRRHGPYSENPGVVRDKAGHGEMVTKSWEQGRWEVGPREASYEESGRVHDPRSDMGWFPCAGAGVEEAGPGRATWSSAGMAVVPSHLTTGCFAESRVLIPPSLLPPPSLSPPSPSPGRAWGMVLGFELCASHSLDGRSTTWDTSPVLFCVGCFWDMVSWTVCLGWLQTMIFLISASWKARITGVSCQHWACLFLFCFVFCL
jgi:hypothetical protein